jgi:hypothetical protein
MPPGTQQPAFTIDSFSNYEKLFRQKLLVGEVGMHILVVVIQQFIVGMLISSVVAVVVDRMLLFVAMVSVTLDHANEGINALATRPEPLKAQDLNQIAQLIRATQYLFDSVDEKPLSGLGLCFFCSVGVPIFELGFWLFVLVQLAVSSGIETDALGLGGFALCRCVCSLCLLTFVVHSFSGVTSKCEKTLCKLRSLSIRNFDAAADPCISKDVTDKISTIAMYMQSQNSGQGMGVPIVGQRVSFTSSKVLLAVCAFVFVGLQPFASNFFHFNGAT